MYLIDSQVLYWIRKGDLKRLVKVLPVLENPRHEICYSVITPWEFSIKQAKGKIKLPVAFYEGIESLGLRCLPILEPHVTALRGLPMLHGDPFDRMLVAQAKAEGLTFISADLALKAYPIKFLAA